MDNKKEDDNNKEVNNKDDTDQKRESNLMKIRKWLSTQRFLILII